MGCRENCTVSGEGIKDVCNTRSGRKSSKMITEHSAPETRQFQLMQADKRQALLGIMSTVSLVEGK